MTEPKPAGRAPRGEDVRLGAALFATILLAAGSALIYPPAGLIVPGAIILAGSVVGSLRAGAK